MKKYIEPSIRVKAIKMESELMATSVQGGGVLKDVVYDGVNENDAIEVDSKVFNKPSLWDDED